MRIPFQERKNYILNILEENGYVKVSELSKNLGVSEITVRKDLEQMEAEGLLIKTFGGAKPQDSFLPEFSPSKKINKMKEEKKRIGAYGASLVNDGDTIFMDTGTTSYYVCKALKKKKNITIVTNSLIILNEARFNRNIEVILLGGNFDPILYSLNGPLTENNIKNFRAKICFLGTDGITPSIGATANNIHASQITKRMIMYSEKVILVADHTKIGKIGPIKYAECSDFDLFITDNKISDEYYQAFLNVGLEIKKV